MKNIPIYLLLAFLLFSCAKKHYISEDCGKSKKIMNTKTLSVLDTLIGYNPIGKLETSFNQINHPTYIFFKTNKLNSGGLYNDEIIYKDIGKLAKLKSVDVIFETDLKIANLYGLEIVENRIRNSCLFIADEKKVIQEIYENSCEEDIVSILNRIQTSPNKK